MNLEIISKYPKQLKYKTPLLFVHGAWHAAWCWDIHFLDYFAEQGFAAHALSLRGHGKSDGHEKLRWTRLSDYVEDISKTVQQLPSTPIIIGHSMGGLLVQKYLEKYTLPGAVLLASVPPAGVLATTVRILRNHPLVFAKINLTLSLFPLVTTVQMVHKTLFSDNMDKEKVTAYAKKLQNESYLGFLDMLMFSLPKPKKVAKTPLLVLGAAYDMLFKPNEIKATARAYETNAEIFDDMAHDMMLEAKWKFVAERILQWIDETRIGGAIETQSDAEKQQTA